MSKRAAAIELSPDQRALLTGWVKAHGTPQQVVKRCRIVLLADQGMNDVEIAEDLELNRHTCRLWRTRFLSEGADALWRVAEGRGRKPQPGLAARVVKATLETTPQGQARWTTRSMAKTQGVASSTIRRIWQDHGLQPHRPQTQSRRRPQEMVDSRGRDRDSLPSRAVRGSDERRRRG
jgi:transposase